MNEEILVYNQAEEVIGNLISEHLTQAHVLTPRYFFPPTDVNIDDVVAKHVLIVVVGMSE